MSLNEKLCKLLDTDEGFDNQELANKIESELKTFAIRFGDWLEKLQPHRKVSVWSKNGEHQGLFSMDAEQLLERFIREDSKTV